MRLSVTQSTMVRFDNPQRVVLQSQRLVPADYKGQTVLDWQVETGGAIVGSEFRDGAGDGTVTARCEGPIDAVEITVRGIVETHDTAGVLSGLREKIAPPAYFRPTRATRPDMAMLELAETSVAELGADAAVLDTAHALSAAVKAALSEPKEIDAEDAPTGDQAQAASGALALGQGDSVAHAHLLIGLAIASDIPARFVWGYALGGDPEDARDPLEVDGGGLHGWAELHVGGIGWIGFDALNGCCPDDRYIRLCSGFDAMDAAPIRTVATDSADSDTEIIVAAAAMGQHQQQ